MATVAAAVLRPLAILLAASRCGLVALLLQAWLRPNRAVVDARLALEHWDAVADGMHNSNTDMIWWRDAATSDDAVTWTPFEPVGPEGWLFWRPKSPDGGATWYVPAYWRDHGESILLRSRDGRGWERVSAIHRGDGNDETALEFLPGGRLLATARLEVTPDTVLGHCDAGTAIAVADPPYTTWRTARSQVTRLDGPALFRVGDTVFAVARHQPGARGWWTRLGGVLSRKRTALYRVEPGRLVHLSDLPSAGDTSYAGVVVRDGHVHVDYYTSRIDRDFPWLLGMFLRSDVRVARIPVESLLALSRDTP